jgi:hypothetical protein
MRKVRREPMDIYFEEAEAAEIKTPDEEISSPRQIDEESLIDVIQISTESWGSLTAEENIKKLQNYYIDVALYNRKLELFKMGYFDVFEPPDESLFKDSLALSMESRMSIEACAEPIPPETDKEFERKGEMKLDEERDEISPGACQHAGLPDLMKSVLSFFSTTQGCLSS